MSNNELETLPHLWRAHLSISQCALWLWHWFDNHIFYHPTCLLGGIPVVELDVVMFKY